MLDHIHIQNYRLFKDLKIDKLGQVNLIAGKNNTGKTALLEALRIMVNGTDLTICNIIDSRGDFYPNDKDIFSTLFSNREYENKKITLQFIYNKKNDKMEIKYGHLKKKYSFFIEAGLNPSNEDIMELEFVQNPQIFERSSDLFFLSFQNDENLITELWKRISLTPKEDDVVQIMKVIDSRIIKVRVDDKKTKVLLKGYDEPIPLKNLGDGANRLFSIALVLANCKDKIFLIDEFEVGLHHSVQDQLWDIIFKYAKEWNIQVFATTHSRDTVKSFTSIAQKEEYKDMANYFRLQKLRNSEDIVAVHYNEQNLKTAIEQDIETR